MSAKGRSPEEWISFLLTCMDYTSAKPDWNQIAQDTGAYKSGKFVNQAYVNLRKKYGPLPGSTGSAASVPATPRSTKKHAAQATDQEDDVDDKAERKPKRARKAATPKKVKAKAERESDDEEKANAVKFEQSEDELNGNATVNGDDGNEELGEDW